MPSLTQPFVNDAAEIFAHANICEKFKPCLKIQIFSRWVRIMGKK